VNDLSLSGQWPSREAFYVELELLLKARQSTQALRDQFYCSSGLGSCNVTPLHTVQHAILNWSDQTSRRAAMAWITHGPFWDQNRMPEEDDYFEFEHADVTDQGLGEAARRRINHTDASVFSFLGGLERFEVNSLTVDHGIPEEPLGSIIVPNYFDPAVLPDLTRTLPTTWRELLEGVRDRFPGLVFSVEALLENLAGRPFDFVIAKAALEQFQCLQLIVTETAADGSLTASGLQIHNQRFHGKRAWFSTESNQKQNEYVNELTFRDPSEPGKDIFCPWHGKISRETYRIHFEWERPRGQRTIKIVYLGPKITID